MEVRAPQHDGDVLLWPAAANWPDLARQAAERIARPQEADRARLLNLPLAQARERARRSLPTFDGRPDPGRLWIVTGHQTYPYHAGVWAKNAAIDALARRVGGAAINLGVDHDLPRQAEQFAWPAMDASGQIVRRAGLPLNPRQPFERQPAPDADTIDSLCRQVQADLAQLWAAPDACVLPADTGRSESFAAWFTRARARLDRQLGLTLFDGLTSQLADSDAFLLFVADAAARAGQFRDTYNAAIAYARRETGHDPAADLGAAELPFWVVRADSLRRRLCVDPAPGGVRLRDDTGALGELTAGDLTDADRAVARLRAILHAAGATVRPRALTLTLFVRLLLSDLFVHGVGGAHYDVATDRLFGPLFGVGAPAYVAASATLWLPLDVASANADQVRQARHRLRDMRFNPQRHLPHAELSRQPAADLLAARSQAIERGQCLRNAALELSAQDLRRERADVFERIRRLNRDLASMVDDDLALRQAELAELVRRHQAGQVVRARDYYYGLFAHPRLASLRDAIRSRL